MGLDTGWYNVLVPFEWIFTLWDLFPILTPFSIFVPVPLRTSAFNLGRISMTCHGVVKPSVNSYLDMSVCAAQKMMGSMWNDWGAQ